MAQPRLYDTFWNADWPLWLCNRGAEDMAMEDCESIGFNLYSMVIRAAVDRMGMAMGHDALVHADVARGDLVYPFADFCLCAKSFYVTPPSGSLAAHDEVFLDWLRDQALDQRQLSERQIDSVH